MLGGALDVFVRGGDVLFRASQKLIQLFSANPTFSECRTVTLQYHIRYSLAILTNYFAILTIT